MRRASLRRAVRWGAGALVSYGVMLWVMLDGFRVLMAGQPLSLWHFAALLGTWIACRAALSLATEALDHRDDEEKDSR